MRILTVQDGLRNGGAERQMALLASSLPQGYAVQVLALEDGPYRTVLEELGVPVQVVPRRYRFDATPALRMWSTARRFRPDVVHVWGWMSAAAMLPWCRATGVPLLNGSIRRGSLPPNRVTEERITVALSDGVVANSRAGLRANGVPDERGRVVYNAFDESRLAEARNLPAIPRDPSRTTVVMAARMVPAKDWRSLLRAARALTATDATGWRFVALGSGRDREAVMQEAADLVAAGTVEFPPGGIEVLPMIDAADIGVLLTDRKTAEGCSNSVMEYMACGLPVVCTDSGGNPELVLEDRTGHLVPAGDDAAVVDALRRLRGDRAASSAMGEAGRKRILEEFSIPAMVDAFTSVYDWVASDRAVSFEPGDREPRCGSS